jgi:hypothetical protein
VTNQGHILQRRGHSDRLAGAEATLASLPESTASTGKPVDDEQRDPAWFERVEQRLRSTRLVWRRGEEHDQDGAAEPAVLAVVAPQGEPTSSRAQIAGADVGVATTDAEVDSIAASSDAERSAPRRADGFAAWVAAQRRAGVRPTGRMVVEAGFAGSEATGRRWLRDLREQTAHLEEAQA